MSGSTTVFAITGSVQEYTVKTTGVYEIFAYGAQGGYGPATGPGGAGAEMAGYFTLFAGEQLDIIVGGQGASGGFGPGYGGGGGGGSFVMADGAPLIIAGGGGGSAFGGAGGYAGQTSAAGSSGGGTHGPGLGGAGRNPGTGGPTYGGGGGGYSGGNGSVRGTTATAGSGQGFGYAGGSQLAPGGFGGGGGGGINGGGGGGGFGGGGGGGYYGGGGGGGSVDRGTTAITKPGENTGNGKVVLEMVCYLHGTRILTPQGEMPVEALQIGDAVVSRFSGIQPIRWIGRQSFDRRFVSGNMERMPICIHAGALGDRQPARDLYVSPGHAVLVGDQLVLAANLVNGVTITQDWAPAQIHYYHIELDHHDCVIAEGAWAETYADTVGMRARFHNAASFQPGGPAPSEPVLCRPRPQSGPALDAALRPVVARAACGLPPGRLEGYVDRADAPGIIQGWARDLAHPDLPVLLEVVVDGTVIGAVLACDFRDDLAAAGIGRGRCAFTVTTPEPLTQAMLARVELRRAADGATLTRALAAAA